MTAAQIIEAYRRMTSAASAPEPETVYMDVAVPVEVGTTIEADGRCWRIGWRAPRPGGFKIMLVETK